MKKLIRIIAAAMCIAILGVTLCSCQYLDDKKDNRAVFCGTNRDSLTFRGITYKKINLPSKLSINLNNSGEYEQAYASDEEVPLLLDPFFGYNMYFDGEMEHPDIIEVDLSTVTMSKDIKGVTVEVLKSSHYYDYSPLTEWYYVIDDKYDDIVKKIENAELDYYFITKYDESKEYFYDSDSEFIDLYENALVSDEVRKAVNDTLKEGETVKYTDLDTVRCETLDIIPCDKDMLLTDNNNVVIFRNQQDYYLLKTVTGVATGDKVIKVPKKYVEVFDRFFSENQSTVYDSAIEDCFYTEEDYPER